MAPPTFLEMATALGIAEPPKDATPGCGCLYCATGAFWCSQRSQPLGVPSSMSRGTSIQFRRFANLQTVSRKED